jgi:hypothetical protein
MNHDVVIVNDEDAVWPSAAVTVEAVKRKKKLVTIPKNGILEFSLQARKNNMRVCARG